MKKYNIQNIDELKARRFELKKKSDAELLQIRKNFSLFTDKFTLKGFLGSHINKNTLTELDGKLGITQKVLSFVFPMLLNKTIFRGAGFLSKILVNFTGAKIGAKLDLENLGGLYHLAKEYALSLFASSPSTKKPEKEAANKKETLSRRSPIIEEEVLGI